MQFSRPSMVCDFMELYRHLIDDHLIDFCQDLEPRYFSAKAARNSSKHSYLKDELTTAMVDRLYGLFLMKVPCIG